MSEGTEPRRLMVIILNEPQLLDDLLSGFLELGVPGGTIVESRGMGQIVREDMPIFAGLAALFPENSGSRMILSVMRASQVEQVFELVEEIVGQLEQSNSAVCFTLLVDDFRGIRH